LRLLSDGAAVHHAKSACGARGTLIGGWRPSAASRYTGWRFSRITGHAGGYLNGRSISGQLWQRRWAGSSPCAFPSLLINGSRGIAVGMATNIPPHTSRNHQRHHWRCPDPVQRRRCSKLCRGRITDCGLHSGGRALWTRILRPRLAGLRHRERW
jgi:hypothetical protein